MRIIGLQAENFKRLKSVNITIPEGKTELQIVGCNDAGKSSFMDSVEAALSGSKGTPFEPINHSAEEARLIVKLRDKDETLIVTKVFKKDKKPALSVKNENATFNSPQELLDSFIGALSFDPTVFYNMKHDDQYDLLKDMLGLGEIDIIEKQNDVDFAARTLINRDLKTLQAQIQGLGEIKEIGEYIDVNKLINKLQKSNEKNNEIHINRLKRSTIINEIEAKTKQIKQLQIDIEKLTQQVNEIKEEQGIDLSELKKQIKDAEENNKNYQENKLKFEKNIEWKKTAEILSNKSNAYTNALKLRDEKKLKLLSKTKMPIKGLSLENKIIRYNGTALVGCSTSVKMKVSFAIGMALNPNLKVIFMRNASLLDENNLNVIRELAKEKEYDIWLELLENKGKGKNIMQIIIEDGEVL